MGIWRDSQWYDRYFRKHAVTSVADPDKLSTAPLYQAVKRWVIRQGLPVVDVGCGPGHMYTELRKSGFVLPYLGIDFSEAALEMAKARRVGEDPSFLLLRMDLEEEGAAIPRLSHPGIQGCSYIVCETLEHLKDDIALIKKIPKNSPVLITVPDFNCPSHLRFFDSQQAVKERYGSMLKKFKTSVVSRMSKRQIVRYFLASGLT